MASKSASSSDISFSMDDFVQALDQHDYAFQKGQTVRGTVVELRSDGAIVDIGGKSAAFMPTNEASISYVTDLSELLTVGEARDFLIVREQNVDGQVTLSLRQFEIRQAWETVLDLEETNQSVQVKVTGNNKGGVTVDIAGLRGFIPRSHLDNREDMESLKGQTITANFLEVDQERKRIVMSQRLASRKAGLAGVERGQLVEGTVSGLKPFGAFISFEQNVGLLHIKQISANYVASVAAQFEIGQPIKAMVLNVDESKGRISLSTRILEKYPGEILEKFEEVMDSVESRLGRAQKQLESMDLE